MSARRSLLIALAIAALALVAAWVDFMTAEVFEW